MPQKKEERVLSTNQKTLSLNLNKKRYGTIVEIGAGQEVARKFFEAGAAAGTIAKTMSAYDMVVSDDIYGKAGRYVSQERVEQMIDKEYDLVVKRLNDVRDAESTFFSYAATVAARSYKGVGECHGWIGLRIELEPNAGYSDIILHVRMLEKSAKAQSDSLGNLGVNLIHGAFEHYKEPKKIIECLLDNIGQDKIEVDFIKFSGEFFNDVENRLMQLHLIREWLTRAVIFNADGDASVAGEALYKKSPMIVRGSFKPPTNLHEDMFNSGWTQFSKHDDLAEKGAVKIAEITMAELVSKGSDDEDFIARIDLLNSLGYHVLVSDYLRFFRLRSYLRQFTQSPIGIVLSVLDFDYLLDEKYYDGLEGGILEAMGKLFPDNTHVYVYPTQAKDGEVNLDNVNVGEQNKFIVDYLVHSRKLLKAENVDTSIDFETSQNIIKMIQAGDDAWKSLVPKKVSALIEEKSLFQSK